MTIFLLPLMLACSHHTAKPKDTGGTPQTLPIPDLTGVDLEKLYVDALNLALHNDMREPWAGHTAALAMGAPDCPNIFAGAPDLKIDGLPQDALGTSWSDHCATNGTSYGGWVYWENAVNASGDASQASGQTIQGTRTIVAKGTVSQGSAILYDFEGSGTDSLTQETAPGYSHWDYSSQLNATVTGSLAFPDGSSTTPGGWRSDMYVRYTGGDAQTIEARGNIYMFDARLQDRFDSIASDLTFTGPLGSTPQDCTKEPKGTLSVRDENAFWYDLVFEPLHQNDTGNPYPDTAYTSCDGCGSLYIRGIDQGQKVCPDFSFLWDGSSLSPPPDGDFAYSLRDTLPQEGP